MFDKDGKAGSKAIPTVYLSGQYSSAREALIAAQEKFIKENPLLTRQEALDEWVRLMSGGFYYAALYSPTQNSGRTASGLGDN
jgi:hypothetical protein